MAKKGFRAKLSMAAGRRDRSSGDVPTDPVDDTPAAPGEGRSFEELRRLGVELKSVVTYLTETRLALERRERQQAVVAALGRFALAETSLDELFDEAARRSAETLGVEFSKILELKGDFLLLRTGVGWRPGCVGQARLSCGLGSQAGLVIESRYPVVVDDIATETRFRVPRLFTEHGITSGVSVAIGPRSAPWGILGCHSSRRVRFTDDDIHFVEAVSHVLYEAIERTRSQKAVRSGEERLRLAQEMGGVGSWDWDVDRARLEGSNEFFRIYGVVPRESFTREECEEWLHPDDRAAVVQAVEASLRSGEEFEREFRIIRGDGQVRWLTCRGHVFFGEDRRPVRMLGVVQDVTERKRSAQTLERLVLERTKELREANAALADGRAELRKLTSRLINVQEASFRRLARELHDRFSQDLAVLAIEVGGLPPRAAAPAGEPLIRIRKSLENLAREINDVALQLHPSVLEDLGLAAAIRALCVSFHESTGLEIDCARLEAPANLPGEVGLAFYRIAQECFSNVLEHAAADCLEVSLHCEDSRTLMLTVRDDGAGFDLTDARKRQGLGFVSMQERARQIQGELVIRSAPREGTTVLLTAPLRP